MVPGAQPVAPFSHTTSGEGWLFVTGQIPTDPDNDAAPRPESIEAQTRGALENLKRVLTGGARRRAPASALPALPAARWSKST